MTQPNAPWRATYPHCAAPGCLTVPRKFSRYCRRHHEQIRATGAVNGKTLTKLQVECHARRAREWLLSNAAHPAVQFAVGTMRELLEPKEGATFLRREFDRLWNAGAQPEEMLALWLGVWLWQDAAVRPLEDREFDVNCARALLRCVPARSTISRTGRKQYHRVEGNHARALGESLRLEIGAFAIMAVRSITAAQRNAEAKRASLRGALAQPFDE
jgi:hypothetical protein